MMLIISTGLELLAAALFLVPLCLVWNRVSLGNLKKCFLYFLFSMYLSAVYTLVGMPNVTYIRFELNLNLIPIMGFITDLRSTILNVLLFLPLGLMLPVFWVPFRDWKKTVLFGFGMSCAIEILQMFTFRATDVNDLITNTFGAFLGFLLMDAAMKKCPAIGNLVEEGRSAELYILCAATFAVMFLLQPFAFSILWELVF